MNPYSWYPLRPSLVALPPVSRLAGRCLAGTLRIRMQTTSRKSHSQPTDPMEAFNRDWRSQQRSGPSGIKHRISLAPPATGQHNSAPATARQQHRVNGRYTPGTRDGQSPLYYWRRALIRIVRYSLVRGLLSLSFNLISTHNSGYMVYSLIYLVKA